MLLLDYEGFGESAGQPSFKGLIDSTRAAFEYAQAGSEVVVGFGASLGTAVLARVAADTPLTAVIFESMTDMWHELSLWTSRHGLGSPLWNVADLVAAVSTTDDFNTRHWITKITAPKLFLHFPDDNVTPFEGAWEIFRLAPQPKHFFVTQGEHALQLFLDPVMYRSVVNGWLDGVLNQNPIENRRFQELLETEIQTTLDELGFAPPAGP